MRGDSGEVRVVVVCAARNSGLSGDHAENDGSDGEHSTSRVARRSASGERAVSTVRTDKLFLEISRTIL